MPCVREPSSEVNIRRDESKERNENCVHVEPKVIHRLEKRSEIPTSHVRRPYHREGERGGETRLYWVFVFICAGQDRLTCPPLNPPGFGRLIMTPLRGRI